MDGHSTHSFSHLDIRAVSKCQLDLLSLIDQEGQRTPDALLRYALLRSGLEFRTVRYQAKLLISH